MLVLTVLLSTLPLPGSAAVYEIFPSNADATCNEEFENKANTLVAGDTLVLHGGVYSQSCRRLISGRNGTDLQPIVITAALNEIPIITRPADQHHSYDQNNIEIENSSYIVIRGLHFLRGDSGVRFMGTNHHITFEDNEISQTGNNALTMNSGNSDSMIVRRNHIHDTGLYALGSTEGEGMYLGCHTNTCRVTNSLIEGNYIHHLRSTSSGGNDGIEVKMGSYANVIRDNVIHDTNIGTQYPCIFVYGGGAGINIVEGNAVWNCGEGIYAVSDAVVQNNIVIGSGSGISSYPHSVVTGMKDLTIVNNTIYGVGECFYLRWSGATNALLANNAAYCPGTMAVDATGLSGAQVQSNYVEGAMSGAAIDSAKFFSGGSASVAFVNPATWNFWPAVGSWLRDAANPGLSPALDFNHTPRSNPTDVGAYETNGRAANPGWQIQQGFKGGDTGDTEPPDTVIDSGPANPTSSTSASFTFHSTEAGSSFACQLDGGGFSACTSPKHYTSLAVGAHTFEVKATDGAGIPDTTPAIHNWVILAGPPPPLVLGSLSLPTGELGVAYSAPLVTGGVGPYGISITKGSLPPGLSFNTNNGTLTGTPGPSKGGSFTADITDQAFAKVTGKFRIKLLAALNITTTALKPGTSGKAYKGRVKVKGGAKPYVWTEATSTLAAAGLTLDPAKGIITGTVASPQVINFTVQVTDSLNGNDTQALALTIK